MRLLHAAVNVAGLALGSLATTAPAAELVADIDVPGQAEVTTKAGLQYTLGLGVAFAPDYEGSDDYAAVPLWNLRASNLSHPDTFIQVLGPTLRSTCCRTITGGLASPDATCPTTTMSTTTRSRT
jgi:hypothetical protein